MQRAPTPDPHPATLTMPFDPTKPATGSPNSSAEMRDQLNALKALIDAVPAGPPGPVGPEGPVFASVQIGTVTTGAPGTPAEASVATFGNNVEISFTIPAGQPGPGVSFDDMTSAIALAISGTARNPMTVSDLFLSPTDPPSQADLLTVIAKINEMLAALRR